MDFSRFDNREELEALEAEVQAISADIHIGGLVTQGPRAVRVRIMVKEKGSAKIISELKRIGYTKVSREKFKYPSHYHRSDTSGYYIVRMEKSV